MISIATVHLRDRRYDSAANGLHILTREAYKYVVLTLPA
jgi:hypothetical protein